jgi:hypothetical protein
VGFEVTCIRANGDNQVAFNRGSSGDFRKGFCVLELEHVSGGQFKSLFYNYLELINLLFNKIRS